MAGLGLSDQAISYRVKQGRLFRVHWCVYAVGRPPHTPLERASAAVLACGPGAALSHLGALALWGFASTWPASFEAVVEADRRPIGVRTHRFTCLERHDTRVQLGIRATSPARTILDCAPRLDPRTRTRTVNDALHSPLLTRAQLADVRTRFALHRGAKLLDPFLDAGDGPTRSDLEDDFAAFCARFGLPRPHTNVRVAGHEVDALFPAHRLIVELDGWEFHRDRDAFEDDRDRDADTLQAGFPTIRVTYGRLHDRAEAEAARLRRILNARR